MSYLSPRLEKYTQLKKKIPTPSTLRHPGKLKESPDFNTSVQLYSKPPQGCSWCITVGKHQKNKIPNKRARIKVMKSVLNIYNSYHFCTLSIKACFHPLKLDLPSSLLSFIKCGNCSVYSQYIRSLFFFGSINFLLREEEPTSQLAEQKWDVKKLNSAFLLKRPVLSCRARPQCEQCSICKGHPLVVTLLHRTPRAWFPPAWVCWEVMGLHCQEKAAAVSDGRVLAKSFRGLGGELGMIKVPDPQGLAEFPPLQWRSPARTASDHSLLPSIRTEHPWGGWLSGLYVSTSQSRWTFPRDSAHVWNSSGFKQYHLALSVMV